LEKRGRDPLPKYVEVPESPISKPDLVQKYPYIFNAGLRTPTFFHAAGRMIPWLREIRPDPIAEIHPETAQRHGIKDGQWIAIESPRGRIKQRAKIYDGIDPQVITSEHGWWFPEIKDPGHGWDISNANILTDNAFETCDPNMGSTNLRVCLCNIAPCNEDK
jgi:anaerobic selenocysteine-containing dehydrogenase